MSPDVRITIRQSRRRRQVLLFLSLAVAVTLGQLAISGYAALVALLAPVAFAVVLREWSDSSAGCIILWRLGQWSIARDGREVRVTLDPGAVALPQLVYFSLYAAQLSRRWQIFLFSDSADPEQLRHLRRRITLLDCAQ